MGQVDGRAGMTGAASKGLLSLAVFSFARAAVVSVIRRAKKKKGFKKSYKLFHFLCEFCNPCFVQRGGEKPEPALLGWTPFLSRCAGACPGLRAPGVYHYVGFCGRG